jgi:alkaline phosphatase D
VARIASSFKRGTEDWTISGDVNAFEWRETGGAPGGHLFWQDAAVGNVAFWQAPVKFLGNLRAFAGGRLGFDWYSSGGSYFPDSDIIITGGNGVTLVADIADPGTGWSRAIIKLNAGGDWHIGSLGGPQATNAQILGVLRDVAQIQIRAEFINGNETGGLDDVVLLSKPQARNTDLASAFVTDGPGDHADALTVPLWQGSDAYPVMLA